MTGWTKATIHDEIITICQTHLIHAWLERIHSAERGVGDHFGFEILQRGPATAILAHRWPHNRTNVPFHRVFNYHALSSTDYDPLLTRFVNEQIDVIIEVLPDVGTHTETVLRAYGFTPAWTISWFHIATDDFSFKSLNHHEIKQVAPADLAQFAQLLIAGYGYTGDEAMAWRVFAEHGYAGPNFTCFVAQHAGLSMAGGVVHLSATTALMDGAATFPQGRGLGLQKALLAARIGFAKAHGAIHAFSRTGSGSISQANMQKIGMRVLVTSTAWRRIVNK